MSLAKNKEENFWQGMFFGGLLGGIVGLLLAPQSGKETRKILKKKSKNLPEDILEKKEQVVSKLDDTVDYLKNTSKAITEKMKGELEEQEQQEEQEEIPENPENSETQNLELEIEETQDFLEEKEDKDTKKE